MEVLIWRGDKGNGVRYVGVKLDKYSSISLSKDWTFHHGLALPGLSLEDYSDSALIYVEGYAVAVARANRVGVISRWFGQFTPQYGTVGLIAESGTVTTLELPDFQPFKVKGNSLCVESKPT